MQFMEECFRWYGPGDPVSLDEIRQAGATGIVTALHHIYDGSPWPVEEIAQHKALIEAAGLRWSVVESIPVHNAIKLGAPERETWVAHYQETIRNLAAQGIYTICYNFMSVCDWTRTDAWLGASKRTTGVPPSSSGPFLAVDRCRLSV